MPCPPSQLSVSLNCSTNAAVLTWNSSPNAVSYTGKAVSTDGHNVTCDAGASLSCQLQGLQCGKEYSFTVSASDGDCHSPDSNPVIQTTGERKWHLCSPFTLIHAFDLPGNLTVYSNNNQRLLSLVTFLHMIVYLGVVWSSSVLKLQFFSYFCNKTTTECNSLPPVLAPCTVQNVINSLNCSTNILTISWAQRSTPVNYSARALAQNGTALVCTTQGSSCTLTLKCGEQYTVTVKAISSTCEGQSSVQDIVKSGKFVGMWSLSVIN